jgi:hypothetical protein
MASGFTSSGRKAAIRFSPMPNAKLPITMMVSAIATSPGPQNASPTVPSTHSTVLKIRSSRLRARRSA